MKLELVPEEERWADLGDGADPAAGADPADGWDYESSVGIVRSMVIRWKDVTVELVSELYKARHALSSPGARTDLRPNGRKSTWEEYLSDIGLADRTVRRWLERYVPEERRILEPEELEQRKQIEDRKRQDSASARLARVREAMITGKKPADWDAASERAYQKQMEDRRLAAEKREQMTRDYEAAEAKREEERLRRETLDEELHATKAEVDEAVRIAEERLAQRRAFKERIRVSQAGEKDQFIDALMDYLEELDSDSRRIEACQNIIKVCRNVASELQREKSA